MWQLYLVLAAIPIYLFLIIFFRKHREWLLYYVLGAFGFTLIVTLLVRYLEVENILVAIEVFHTNLVSQFINIPAQALSAGRLRLPMVHGMTILGIGIECSAVLEMSALVGLIAFYPAFSLYRKIMKIIAGLAITYVINIIRMIIIVAMTYHLGNNYVFIAHAIVGRLFFFVCIIVLYWYLITEPTIKGIGSFLSQGQKVTPQTLVKEPLGLIARSGIFMLITPALVGGLTALSFMHSDQWRTAFQGQILPESVLEEQKTVEDKQIIEEVQKTTPSPADPEISQNKATFLSPEVLTDDSIKAELLPALLSWEGDREWKCQVRLTVEEKPKAYYYYWRNLKTGQEIWKGPVKEPQDKILGQPDDLWRCLVSPRLKALYKAKENEQ